MPPKVLSRSVRRQLKTAAPSSWTQHPCVIWPTGMVRSHLVIFVGMNGLIDPLVRRPHSLTWPCSPNHTRILTTAAVEPLVLRSSLLNIVTFLFGPAPCGTHLHRLWTSVPVAVLGSSPNGGLHKDSLGHSNLPSSLPHPLLFSRTPRPLDASSPTRTHDISSGNPASR